MNIFCLENSFYQLTPVSMHRNIVFHFNFVKCVKLILLNKTFTCVCVSSMACFVDIISQLLRHCIPIWWCIVLWTLIVYSDTIKSIAFRFGSTFFCGLYFRPKHNYMTKFSATSQIHILVNLTFSFQ